MRYATAAGFRAALDERLRAYGHTHGQLALTRQRKAVVYDRLMARLLVSAPDRWVMKGGLALDLRFGERARMTKDLDLARSDDESAASKDLQRAQALDLGDHFEYSVRRTKRLDVIQDWAAVRYHVAAMVAGRRFDDVIMDVGFGETLVAPDIIVGSSFLAFAGIEPIHIPALPIEIHIAEKVHAYTRVYGGSRGSTRVKDLLDLCLICSTTRFRADQLQNALNRTFEHRGTQMLPPTLPPPPEQWVAPYRATAIEIGLDPDIAIGFRQVADFLDPLLGGYIAFDAVWTPKFGRWSPE